MLGGFLFVVVFYLKRNRVYYFLNSAMVNFKPIGK
jgi:hypothetical protein